MRTKLIWIVVLFAMVARGEGVHPQTQPSQEELQKLDVVADRNTYDAALELKKVAIDKNAPPKSRRRALFLLGNEMDSGIARDVLFSAIEEIDNKNLKDFGIRMAGD